MELVLIYFIFSIQLQLLLISLRFLCFFPSNFPSWIRIRILNADPDPGRKMNADPDPGRKMNADPDPRPGFQLLIC